MNQTLRLVMPDSLEAVYCNQLLIRHTSSEVTIDAFVVSPDQRAVRVRSRLVMTPVTAKALLQALADNLDDYESTYGPIHLPDDLRLAAEFFGIEEDE